MELHIQEEMISQTTSPCLGSVNVETSFSTLGELSQYFPIHLYYYFCFICQYMLFFSFFSCDGILDLASPSVLCTEVNYVLSV